MSARELAKSLIDQVPENKLLYIIAYLQGLLFRMKVKHRMPTRWKPLKNWTTAVVIPTTGRLKI